MNIDVENIATFSAWLQQREAEQTRRLQFCRSEDRRLLLKTEAAELDIIKAEFFRLVINAKADDKRN